MFFAPLPAAVAQQVDAAMAAQDVRSGEGILRRAAELFPDNAGILLRHATLLGLCGCHADARQAFKRFLAGAPKGDRSRWRGLAGSRWLEIGRPDLAEPLLREAAADPEMPPSAHEALVDALERLNRIDEARDAWRRASKRFAGDPGLAVLGVRLLRRGGAWADAEAGARALLAGNPPLPVAVEAGYELGHALDAQGRHREAFAAFAGAKDRCRPQAAVARAAWRAETARLEQGSDLPSAEDFRRFSQDAAARTPSAAFLVGCPRSGTTLVERVLDAHPGLASASETLVWRCEVLLPAVRATGARDMRALYDRCTGEILAPLHAAYRRGLAQAAQAAPGQLLLDKNPSYLRLLPALARTMPGAKVIMALRDPRAVVWSSFTQLLPLNPETAPHLDLADSAANTAALLTLWSRVRARLAQPWLEVRYEDVVADTAGQARRALEFLGLPWNESVLDFHRSSRYAGSPSYAAVGSPVHAQAAEKWRHYEEFLAPHLAPLKGPAADLGYVW